MEHVALAATKRSEKKASLIRTDGFIPAIIYGPGLKTGQEELMIEYQLFRKAFRVAGESTAIDLNVEGKTIPVLVHAYDRDPVTDDFTHLDLYALDLTQDVHTHIQLKFVGTAPVIKEKNGVLVTSREVLEVKCLPKYLVHDIEVDVSGLAEFHDHILVKDVTIPEGITVLDKPDDIVISATPPKKEIEETPVEAPVEGAEGVEGAPAPEAAAEEKKDEEKK